MEENSEVPVDTDDVTFTSENAVQEVSGSHCDIETVVTVEKIKEEDGSPSKEKNIEKTSKLEKKMDGESTKLIEKLPQKDPPIKKIIIKAANKDYQIVKIVQKTPTKPDESQKPLGKDMQLKSTQSTSSSSPDSTKVSSNVETLKSPTKDVQQSPQKTYVKNVEVQKTIQKSPAKNTPADEAMEAVDRASTIREQQANASPVKEQPAKSSQAKETTTKVCLKDLEEPPPPPLLSTNNELFGKMVRAMELSKTSSLKEPPMLTTSNEMFHKKVQAMEPSKTSSLKEQPSKTTPTKEVSKEPVKEILKSSSAEEVSKVTPTKDTPTKATRAKEKLTKAALKEASTLEKQDREESDSSKTGEASKNTSTTPMEVDKEYSNDSQIETNSDTSEKEHNKSISRELRSLINSAKESKIISECTQLTSKTRKSRVPLDQLHNASLNTSQEADKIQGIRRGSDNSQKSGSSERSEKAIKRSMRSQNPEFVNKVKQFLNSVTGKTQKEGEISDEEIEEPKSKEEASESRSSTPKRKKIEVAEVPVSTKTVEEEKSNKLRTDPYCWRCHWALESNEKGHPSMICTVCPRSFHYKCLSVPERSKINTEKSWVCPECLSILQAESSDTRSPAMKKISLGMLCELLKYALERMMEINGVEPFMHPVDRTVFPDYDKYVVHPMDLTLMKQNIAEGLYGSTEAFLADAQWILHNSIIFNTLQSKLTGGARALVRSCRAEMGEIEACPECYSAAHARRPTWFTDVCSTPHILLWAKLKGFPFWPAKGMSVNTSGLVDVRFFGAHDRAWVPARDCFLYSEKDPNNFRTKRQDILDSMQEAEHHIRNISRKYGKFVYPPAKIQFDPTKLNEQLKMMIPSFEGEVRSPTKNKTPSASPGMVKEKSRSASKSSKGSTNDGETSESEDTSVATSRKMADGAEIAREEEEIVVTVEREKEKSMEVDPLKISEEDKSRKRRRSQLEEAVITIMDTSSKEKKKRTEGIEKPDKEAISQEKEESGIKETAETSKEQEKHEKNKIQESPKAKDNEPSTSAKKMRSSPGAPIRLISIAKVLKTAKVNINVSSTPKDPLKISTAKDDGPKEGTPKSNTPKDSASKATTPKDSASKTSTRKDSGPKSCTSKESGPKDSGLKTSTPKDNASKTTTSKDNNTNAAPKTNTTKDNTSKLSTPKDNEKTQRKSSISRSSSVETVNTSEEKSNDQKRRNSRSNKSLNSSNASKTEKALDKKNEKAETSNKEKSKEIVASKTNMDKAVANKNSTDKNTSSSSNADSPKSKFDDDTSLAVIARETAKTHTTTNVTGLPTITSVRSLSNPEITAKTTQPRSIEITIEATSDSSIFTPTSTENVRNMKEAVNKLQKLRSDTEPPPQVGRVGVRAFARMTSPPDERPANNMQVEIKSEPIDLDDADRQVEKMDLMNAFKLRPVNGPSNLREVRMNKVVVSSGNSSNNNSNINKRIAPKPPEIRPRAKKTFPQPKKADDGRSELNSKNSMVYIPIQPPMTQAPVRLPRPVNANGPASTPPAPRVMAPSTSTSNNIVNTVTPPLVPVSMSTLSSPMSTSTVNSDSSPIQSVHTVGQVPTTVHTVPLITSVNGQWTFSLQPVMSVGGVDGAPSPPMLNGLPERNTSGGASLLPIGGAAPAAGVTQPVAPTPPVLVPTAATLTANRSERDNTPGEPPKLLQRPSLVNPLDPNATVGTIPPPSTVGPLTAKLNQNAVKMTDFFRTLLEDTLEKVDEPNARLTTVKLQLEQASWRHQQQIKEIEHNHDVRIAEMRATYEKEKIRLVSETRRAAQVELEAAVKLAKSKQWCANCSQEAQFYCCWNTSYCDYPCQRAHWAQHYAVCTQQRSQDSNDNNANPSDRLQPPPDNLPKTTAAPNLTVGGKLAPSRVYTQDNNPKQSLIVSMVEDQTGNQSLKCVGTYKSPQQVPNQMSPLIINKQLMNNEEAAKKAVSSGGYIIVGAANTNSGSPNNTATIVTPSRRTHTIQYYN